MEDPLDIGRRTGAKKGKKSTSFFEGGATGTNRQKKSEKEGPGASETEASGSGWIKPQECPTVLKVPEPETNRKGRTSPKECNRKQLTLTHS